MAPAVCLPSRCREEPAEATATATATSPLKQALGYKLFSTVSSTSLDARNSVPATRTQQMQRHHLRQSAKLLHTRRGMNGSCCVSPQSLPRGASRCDCDCYGNLSLEAGTGL